MSRILDTFYYLYGESYKSEIRTLSTAARRSILSIVGEYVSLAMLLIVDFETPVKVASCRADTFLLYIISANNIFILLLLQFLPLLYEGRGELIWHEGVKKVMVVCTTCFYGL